VGTNKALVAVGRQNMTDEAAQEVGAKVIRDLIKAALQKAGVSNAVGVEIALTNGERIVILSDSNPANNIPATEVRGYDKGKPEVRLQQSARAGRR
jgi:hypothetical protein